jgi:glycosyltransferase involved in cell wall biosynthesis
VLRASVIVPARNARLTLPRTLAALAAQEFEAGAYEVIVVDDGSTDDTAALAGSAPGPVNVVAQPPRGPAVARNLGVEASSGSALAFCDADVFPTPGWLAAGVAALADADLVQGRVLPDPQARSGPFDRTISITSQVGLWETANLFATRDLFERVGGFEEWLRPRSGKPLAEDVWFGHQALRSGARPGFCSEALAYHAVFPRSRRAFVGERRRLEYFPAMVRKMPELRRELLAHGLFLTDRTAAFDLALVAALTAARRARAWPLLGTGPYLAALATNARWRVQPRSRAGVATVATVALTDLAADAVGLLALLAGTVRYRSAIL